MKYVLTAGAYLVSLVLTAIAASFALIALVGPHGGMLPRTFEKPVLALAWLSVIALPVLSARWMWRYVSKVLSKTAA